MSHVDELYNLNGAGTIYNVNKKHGGPRVLFERYPLLEIVSGRHIHGKYSQGSNSDPHKLHISE